MVTDVVCSNVRKGMIFCQRRASETLWRELGFSQRVDAAYKCVSYPDIANLGRSVVLSVFWNAIATA